MGLLAKYISIVTVMAAGFMIVIIWIVSEFMINKYIMKLVGINTTVLQNFISGKLHIKDLLTLPVDRSDEIGALARHTKDYIINNLVNYPTIDSHMKHHIEINLNNYDKLFELLKRNVSILYISFDDEYESEEYTYIFKPLIKKMICKILVGHNISIYKVLRNCIIAVSYYDGDLSNTKNMLEATVEAYIETYSNINYFQEQNEYTIPKVLFGITYGECLVGLMPYCTKDNELHSIISQKYTLFSGFQKIMDLCEDLQINQGKKEGFRYIEWEIIGLPMNLCSRYAEAGRFVSCLTFSPEFYAKIKDYLEPHILIDDVRYESRTKNHIFVYDVHINVQKNNYIIGDYINNDIKHKIIQRQGAILELDIQDSTKMLEELGLDGYTQLLYLQKHGLIMSMTRPDFDTVIAGDGITSVTYESTIELRTLG